VYNKVYARLTPPVPVPRSIVHYHGGYRTTIPSYTAGVIRTVKTLSWSVEEESVLVWTWFPSIPGRAGGPVWLITWGRIIQREGKLMTKIRKRKVEK